MNTDPKHESRLKMKLTLSGVKELLLPPRAIPNSDTWAARARALFGRPDTVASERRRSLEDFLKDVTLFEDLRRGDLRRLARIVHEREYHDGECICEQGKPGAALFALRHGLVEIVTRSSSGQEVAVATLEPPSTFEEWAAMGTQSTRVFSARARGPVSLLALGKSDLDALMVNFPLVANKVLMSLAGLMATRLQTLAYAQYLNEPEEPQESSQ
jgi:CRP-like cAMP-binding protein